MKRFLSLLLAALLLLTLSPLALAEDSPVPGYPVLLDGHPEDHRPPVPGQALTVADDTAFHADAQYTVGTLNITIQEAGDYFSGVTWTARVSGGSGSYTYSFHVIKPTEENGKTIYYSIAQQNGASASYSYKFTENGEYELWVDVTDTQKNIWARETKALSVHGDGFEPLSFTVSVSGEAFVGPTTWTVNATGGSGSYEYQIYLSGLFPDESADTITYNKGNVKDNRLSYRLLSNGDYTLHVWLTDTVNQTQKYARFNYSFYSQNQTSVSEKVAALVAECRAAGCKTDYETALWLHDWLIHNADYDDPQTIYGPDGVLLGGKGVCDSYSKAFCLLLTEAGIPVMRVQGGNHSWNAICLDGDWYYIDVTWDDPTGGGYENHIYFCVPEDILTMDHTIESAHPECVSCAYNYYAQSGDGSRWADDLAPTVQSGLQAGDAAYSFPMPGSYSAEWWRYSDRSKTAVAVADKVALMLAQAKTYTFGGEVVPLVLFKPLMGESIAYAMINFEGKSFEMPADLTIIEENAFRDNRSVVLVTIPEGVSEIGSGAFAGCSGLWVVQIPASVTKIGDNAFDSGNRHLTLAVEKGSAADQYAKANGIKCSYNAP